MIQKYLSIFSSASSNTTVYILYAVCGLVSGLVIILVVVLIVLRKTSAKTGINKQATTISIIKTIESFTNVFLCFDISTGSVTPINKQNEIRDEQKSNANEQNEIRDEQKSNANDFVSQNILKTQLNILYAMTDILQYTLFSWCRKTVCTRMKGALTWNLSTDLKSQRAKYIQSMGIYSPSVGKSHPLWESLILHSKMPSVKLTLLNLYMQRWEVFKL